MNNIIFLVTLTISIGGCFGIKPFQPPPAEYESWEKSGVSDPEVRRTLLACGYPNPYGFDRDYIPNDVAIAEQCMFSRGFRRNDSYKGICAVPNRRDLPACNGRKCTSDREPGCSPDDLNRPILKSIHELKKND